MEAAKARPGELGAEGEELPAGVDAVSSFNSSAAVFLAKTPRVAVFVSYKGLQSFLVCWKNSAKGSLITFIPPMASELSSLIDKQLRSYEDVESGKGSYSKVFHSQRVLLGAVGRYACTAMVEHCLCTHKSIAWRFMTAA